MSTSSSPRPPSPPPALIRPAVPSDALSGSLAHLSSWQTSFTHLLTPTQLASLPTYVDFVSSAPFLARIVHPQTTTLVAVHPVSGDVVGFATATSEEDEHGYLTLQSMYMSEGWTGQGLGTRLEEAILPRRSDGGEGEKRRALVVCLEGNEKGRAFYHRLGFTRHVRTDLVDGLGIKNVTLARDAGGVEVANVKATLSNY